jgi:flagellar basal-body rod modification protein FlgD
MSTASSIASTLLPSVTGTSTATTVANPNSSLQPSDFINMMVTQLENQDPLDPTSDTDLLTQMSEIGQLQSTNSLQTSISSMVLQNQIGSGASLIGQQVTGTDANANSVTGLVSSVQVNGSAVSLQLSNGSLLPITQVNTISAPTVTPTSPASNSSTTGS